MPCDRSDSLAFLSSHSFLLRKPGRGSSSGRHETIGGVRLLVFGSLRQFSYKALAVLELELREPPA